MYGTSWPNFKIVVSWGVGRPRRWGNSQLMEPEHTHLSIKVTNLCGHFSCYFNGVSKPDIYIYHQRSVTIDHHNKYNKSEKVWNIVRITKLWHRDTNWANSVGKMVPIDLLNTGLPHPFNLWKTQYLWSAIEQSAIKQVIIIASILLLKS